MTVKVIPLTTYSIRQTKAGHKFGSPGVIPLRLGGAGTLRMLARAPLDIIPVDAVISSAVVNMWNSAPASGSIPARVFPITEGWKSAVTYSTRPSFGPLITTDVQAGPGANTLWEFDVTAWTSPRSRFGLMFDVNTTTVLKMRGSSAANNKPVLIVTYTVPPDVPVGQVPQGGAVSVSQPVLTYTGDTDMTEQWVEYSSDGTTAGTVYQSGWLTASQGYYDPAADTGAGTGMTGAIPNLADGESIYWRVKTNGPNGESDFSDWVEYSYQPIVPPVITAPPAVTDDGSPTLQWTVTDQTSWSATLKEGSKLKDSHDWEDDAAERSWLPGSGVKVPDGAGRFTLRTRDSITPRVMAVGAPTYSEVTVDFTTALVGSGPTVDSLDLEFQEPVPVLYGTRSLGIPDEISLFRDGVQVPIWNADGDPVRWAPGADFFTGNDFEIRDYTADLRRTHTWSVRTRAGGVISAEGPTVTATLVTQSVWVVDPRTGDQIEIQGYNAIPTVDQSTEEGSVLHTPVHGDLIAEPVRRRLVRTTRSGSINGLVINDDEDTLQGWVEQDSSLRYRLIFGKVNWPIIIGDYSPTDVFYINPDPTCDDLMVVVLFNWWQRLAD